MSTVNLYDILEVESSATRKEIIQSYRKLVRKYHPDKLGGNVELYELINHAFDILGNKNKRDEYDELRKLSDNSSKRFNELKSDFKKFNENITPLTEDERNKLQYEVFKNTETIENEDKLSKDESDKLIEDVELLRDQDDIENTHDKVFNGNDFDLNKFNKLYDKIHKKNQLTQYIEKPHASNVNMNNDNGTDLNNSFNETLKEVTKEDLDNLDDSSDEPKYEDLDDLLEKQLKNREDIQNMNFKEFETHEKSDFTVTGHLLQGDVSQLEWENEEEILDRYKRLLKFREQNKSNEQTMSNKSK